MTTSDDPLGHRDPDTSISSETGLPANVALSDVFAKVYLEPGEASRLLSALASLLDNDEAAAQHLRYCAAKVGDPANYSPPTRSSSRASSSGT